MRFSTYIVMVKVPSAEKVKAAYAASAGRASTAYRDAVQDVTNWASEAGSEQAESRWAAKVQEAVAAKRRQKALSGVSNEEWKSRALTKGAAQIGTAISQSADKQAKAVAPYLSAIAGVTLPPKSIDGLQNVTARVGAIASALIAKKRELKG